MFPTDAEGNQISSDPLTIVDDSSKQGTLSSFYVQDEWRIDPRFTFNYGLRFDHVAAFTNEHQLSPRINALWKVTDATAVHAGYARYFTPPPQELVAQASIDLFRNTTNAPVVPVSDTVKAERTHYFDVGVYRMTSHRGWTAGVDAYYKRVTNLLDEGQFGQALILTPFNYAEGRVQGVEFSTTYSRAPWSGYLNLGDQQGQGQEHRLGTVALRSGRACLHRGSLHLCRPRPALFAVRRAYLSVRQCRSRECRHAVRQRTSQHAGRRTSELGQAAQLLDG